MTIAPGSAVTEPRWVRAVLIGLTCAFLGVVLVLPFVLRSVYVSLRNFDRRLELAAASLGA